MLSYFLGIMLFGSYFAKYNRSTNDFFYGGRRFSWWLIAISIVATGVGSYSFVKYSAKGFEYGLSSTMTYMNDWFFMPFFLFGWLPIVVYTRIKSIPEYFEKRFSPAVRMIATVFQLLYMIGYLGIGLLTLGKVFTPLLPEIVSLFGINIHITLYFVIVTIALITGVYTTFGGQTAVIFTDLIQGGILIITGIIIFLMGISYVGGFDVFWNLLPTSWKLPLANFNNPPDFNFVGIFWQDGIAGSVGFLFMNMGLLMRFMSAKSVNEGRKAAVFNVLFMLPVSAIIVGGAGWIGKALTETVPAQLSRSVNPDEVFIAVTHIISSKGVFGFVLAALTATLLSTVDSLINAISAVYINDVHRPIKKLIGKRVESEFIEGKKELTAARVASIVFTIVGILATVPFNNYPTVYEAHGYFHSTLTPPLVTAIFLGVFWKRFTPAGVMAIFIGGSSFMIIGARYPDFLISPIAHGTRMDLAHPYIYISALYNLIVCLGVGVIVTFFQSTLEKQRNKILRFKNHKNIMRATIFIIIILLILIWMNIGELPILLLLGISLTICSSIASVYYIKFDPKINLLGLTAWSIKEAKEIFKGGQINDKEGRNVLVNWKLKEDEEDVVNFSDDDMQRLSAKPGDIIYLSDRRKYLGGLKSIHTKAGESHKEPGIVYINNEHRMTALFVENKLLVAEKEM